MAVQYAFGKIITQGLDLNVDAADPTSYPGSGNTWTSVVNRSITGSVISCSFSSDFKGGIVFDNPSASVEFPGTVANYGTGSFTIEMAFRPSSIEGIHYLVSKNSGSFPNWGVYLSGSGGSGKLFAEYNIDATVSCSVSSSTVFETGSNYFVDINYQPSVPTIIISLDGNYQIIDVGGNGTGSLTTTSSLFIGNSTVSSSQSYLGSIFNTKVYLTSTSGLTNYKSIYTRINKPAPQFSLMYGLLVGGGGGGGGAIGGGGGAGGIVTFESTIPPGTYIVNVGAGGAGGNISRGQSGSITSLGNLYTAYGGGGGGEYVATNGTDGASGGGGGSGRFSGSAIYGTQGQNGANGLGGAAGGGGGGGFRTPGVNNFGGSGSFFPFYSTLGFGSPIGWFGGGGGGGTNGGSPGENGGIGGGGKGNIASTQNGVSGSANTGGGGGGGGWTPGRIGGNGGSGIVIIRYPGSPIATGGTITQVAGDTTHTFTATGSHTFTVF
jgi:hypothetical protein